MEAPAAARPNRLAGSASLYLRQHAYQPVDWYPWGPEAHERARRQNRPILLSIGYSACHWCHVMAHESFEDPEVARWMNEHFVCIKVDREERPDVDQVYQVACQLTTGQGGWPLTAFLTPQLEPFFVGTYFPPRARLGRPGFVEVLRAISQAWQEKEAELRQYAQQLAEAVRQVLRPQLEARPGGPGSADPAPSDAAVHAGGPAAATTRPAGRESLARPQARYLVLAAGRVLAQADPEAGGFGQAPKFPQATVLELLLRAAWRFGHEDARRHLLDSLRRMAWGGLFDHVGGGFHRYTVDRWWQVPHFEKMLYDNALLVPLYLKVGLWQDPQLLTVARRTVAFLLEEMRLPSGGFACSLDADSPDDQGRPAEGFFYRWSADQVEQALQDRQLARWVCQLFAVGEDEPYRAAGPVDGPPGWQEEALSVVGRMPPEPPQLDEHGLRVLEAALQRMREYRARTRRPPARDEKVVLAWHALAVSAMAQAAQAFDGPEGDLCRQAALAGWEFVQEHLRHPRLGLLHVPGSGDDVVPAYADDYAALVHALLDLHRLTLEPAWLAEAAQLMERARTLFADEEGLYSLAAAHHGSPLARPRELWDQALPSANALMASAHARLGALLADEAHLQAAAGIVGYCWPVMLQQPAATAALWCALDRLDEGTATVTVMAPSLQEVQEGLRRLGRLGHPSLELAWKKEPPPARWLLCSGSTCWPPQPSAEALLDHLAPAGRRL